MANPVYLSVDDVWAINALVLRAPDQTSLLLDRGALESALLRAQTAVYYQQADLVEQAALLIAGIAFAHAFLDGNKRTAAVAGVAFLDRNGLHVSTSGDQLGRQIESLVKHSASQDEAVQQFHGWLRSVVEPLP
ncbi:MAG: type II toxin-antitoxin system death-on-curing family toxin [Ktedonobacterales bacterium]